MKWLAKKRRILYSQWNANQITLQEYVQGLHALGYSVEQAWEIASK